MIETLFTIVGNTSTAINFYHGAKKLIYGETVNKKIESTNDKVEDVIREIQNLNSQLASGFKILDKKIAFNPAFFPTISEQGVPQLPDTDIKSILASMQEGLGRATAASNFTATNQLLDTALYRNPDDVFYDIELAAEADLSKWRRDGLVPIRFEHLGRHWIGWQKPFFFESNLGVRLNGEQAFWLPNVSNVMSKLGRPIADTSNSGQVKASKSSSLEKSPNSNLAYLLLIAALVLAIAYGAYLILAAQEDPGTKQGDPSINYKSLIMD